MFTIPKLEALATKAVLGNNVQLDSFQDSEKEVVADLFRFSGSYQLSARTAAVFGLVGNMRGKCQIYFFIFHLFFGSL